MSVVLKDDVVFVIEQFCTYLQKFQCDKAKEFVDDIRNKQTSSPAGTMATATSVDFTSHVGWSGLLQCLSQLSQTEKNYSTLSFLLPRSFLRKESSLRSSYSALANDLEKLNDGCQESSFQENRENTVHVIIQQLRSYVAARLEMMNCYERLSAIASGKTFNVEMFIGIFQEVKTKYADTFNHPLISILRQVFLYECEIILNLLQCDSKLSRLTFFDCLLLLKAAQSNLKLWTNDPSISATTSKSQQGTSWFSLSGSSKSLPLPSLCVWFKRYYDALLSKFSLYFYDLLSQQTNPQEMKGQLSKVRANYYQQIVNFHKKYDAGNVCLVLNAQDLHHFQWQGYHHPDQHFEPLKGLENFPIVFSYPSEQPRYLLPSVVMILTEHAEKLSETERIVPVYDTTKETMFFVTRVETFVFLVLTFNAQRNERDSNVINFISALCSDLRCSSVFSSFKASR